jgi:hypothetical protein
LNGGVQMNYFILNSKLTGKNKEFYTSLDSTGTSLVNKLNDDLSGVDKAFFLMTKDRVLTDKPPSIGDELVLSEKASACFLKECEICPGIKVIKAEFCSRDLTNIFSRDYRLWWSAKQYDVLNRQLSSIRYYKEHILTVREWVLDGKLIPSLDIFLGPTNKWLISNRFRRICEEAEFKGFGFVPVKIT